MKKNIYPFSSFGVIANTHGIKIIDYANISCFENILHLYVCKSFPNLSVISLKRRLLGRDTP